MADLPPPRLIMPSDVIPLLHGAQIPGIDPIAAEAEALASAAIPQTAIGQTVAPLVGGKVPGTDLSFGTTAGTVADGGALATVQALAGAAQALAATSLQPISAFMRPVTGAFGDSALAIGGLPTSGHIEAVATAMRYGAFRSPESFHNTGEDGQVPGANGARTTTGVWSTMEHYQSDFGIGLTVNTTPVINPTIIWQAAVNWCCRINSYLTGKHLPVKACIGLREYTVYENMDRLVIPDAGQLFIHASLNGRCMAHWIIPGDFKKTGQDGTFTNQTQQSATSRAQDVYLSGIHFHRPFTYAIEHWSNVFTTDYQGHWTCTAGAWDGITPQFSIPYSSNPAAIAAMDSHLTTSSTLYFDQVGTDSGGNPVVAVKPITPANNCPTYGAPILLNQAQLQAYVTAAGSPGLSMFDARRLFWGVTVASISYVTGNSSLPGFSGFAIVANPPLNPDQNYGQQSNSPIFQFPVVATKPAQLPTPASDYNPEYQARPAIPIAEVIFTKGVYSPGGTPSLIWNNAPINYPYVARGDNINLIADRISLINCEASGWSAGQGLFNGGGNMMHDRDTKVFCPDARQGNGTIRWHLGTNQAQYGWCLSENHVGRSGDQCLQPQAASLASKSGQFLPWSNQSIDVIIVNPDVASSCAAPIALASPIPNGSQGVICVGNAVAKNTSVATFPPGLAGFTSLGTVYNGPAGTTGGQTLPAAAYAATVGAALVASGYTISVNDNFSNTSANDRLMYVGCNGAGVPPGSFVVGYSDSGGSAGLLAADGLTVSGSPNNTGTITLVIAPPQQNAGQFVIVRPQLAPRFSLSSGIPVGALTLSIRTRVFGGEVYTGALTQAVTNTNQDGSLNSYLEIVGTHVHCWWQWKQGSAGIGLYGSDFGGATMVLRSVRVYDSYSQSIQTTGYCPNIVIGDDCFFGRAQYGRVPGLTGSALPNVYLTGASRAIVGGEIQGNIGAPPLQLGDTDGAVSLSTYQPNSCDDAVLRGLKLTYIESGQPVMTTTNCNSVHVDGVLVKQSAPPGSGLTGSGIQFLATSGAYPVPSINWHISAANFRGYDGVAVTLGSGASAFYSSGAVIGGAGGLPVLPASPALAAIVAATSAAALGALPPTSTPPSTSGTLFNYNGVLSVS